MKSIESSYEDLEQDDLDELESIHSSNSFTSEDSLPLIGKIRIAREQHSVYELLRQEKKKTLVLSPDFQRNLVWNLNDCSELIESVLMGIPIPTIYLFENEFGSRQVVDGKQRISALKMFLYNDFKLTNLKFLPAFDGSLFKDLAPFYQNKIEDYQINSFVIQPPTPESVKFTIFDRVNRGGVSLNKQEIRNGLYQGKSTTLLKDISKSKYFKLCTDNSINSSRMRDQYLILRFFAFHLYFNDELYGFKYKSDTDELLAYTMRHINLMDDNRILHLKYSTEQSLWNIHQLLGSNAFRFKSKNGKRRPINIGLFEILMNAFTIIFPHKNCGDETKKTIDFIKTHLNEYEVNNKNLNSLSSFYRRHSLSNYIQQELTSDK